ncbi:MAG: hypothetical protein AAGA58_19165 [Verrucomicrobiota bacterium]
MPLESREDYIRLNEHLWELDPVAKGFAETNGYEYGPPLANGLYPKLRLWRTRNGISQSINFDMELTEQDERFDEFFPGIPYSVFAGSWIDDEEEHVRHHGPHAGIRRTTFSALRRSLPEFLEYFHAHNETISSELIYACGLKTPISGNPLMADTLYLD